MAQNIIREHRIKGMVVEGEILRNVTFFETHLGSETSRQCEVVRVANSGCINVQPYEAAAHSFRKV